MYAVVKREVDWCGGKAFDDALGCVVLFYTVDSTLLSSKKLLLFNLLLTLRAE